MFKKISFNKMSWLFVLGLILTCSLLWPLFVAPYFTHHDDVQVIRLHQMNECFKDFQIPCRWVPDLGGLYGYPLFNYYGPLAYYFGELPLTLTQDLLFSAKSMFAFSFVGCFVFMYLLGRRLWGEWGGVLAAIFYSFAPYHAVIFYVRGAMGEMWALMWYPAILWALFRLFDKVKITNIILLSLFVAFLITSHNLSAMLFSPILLFFVGFLYLQNRSLRFIKYSLLSIVLGIVIAAFYWLPAISEKSLVHVDTTTYGYFSYTEHFKGLKKLFLDRDWGWGSSVREVPGGPRDGMSFQIGWIHLLGLIGGIIYAIRVFKKKRFDSYVIFFSTFVILGCVFMIHPRSEFVWKLFDSLKYIQFPWRFLGLIIFFVSLVSGAAVLNFKDIRQKIVFGVLLVLVVSFNFWYFRPEQFLYINNHDVVSSPLWDKQIKRSIFDYLPIYAEEPPAELASARYSLLTGDTSVNNFNEGSDHFSFDANTKSHSIIRLSQYYFPEWKILVDGSPVKIDYENHLGLMTIILGVGDHHIEGRLYNTPIRTIANMLTVLGFVVIVGLLLANSTKIRNGAKYYFRSLNR